MLRQIIFLGHCGRASRDDCPLGMMVEQLSSRVGGGGSVQRRPGEGSRHGGETP